MPRLFLTALLFAAILARGAEVTALDWMSGTWVADSERERVTESWLGPGAHDFPQRILYWREGDALVARIEGTMKGEA